MTSDEYYLLNAIKFRVEDGAAICAAASAELAQLREQHGDDFELRRFFIVPPKTAAEAMIWLASSTRLKYLYPGLDIQAEGEFFATADAFDTVPPASDPLDAFWAEVQWQLDPPEPPSGTPTMRLVGTSEDPDTFTVGLAEHPDGSGQGLLFTTPLADEEDTETYCLCTETAATYYGGVRECVLEGDLLRIKLSRAAAEELGIGPELTITLELPEASALEELRNGLRRVLTSGPRRSHPKRLEL
ncbi:Imm10 family immunity protein [Actinomadura terrae]|uniref:Imm10 family immunity protein n=1 Tax=Actinomadura terrae TaxID=604353 RepID=UPI001FA70571|nr:Imm10 family immunity protein [Actinomadura terrae]